MGTLWLKAISALAFIVVFAIDVALKESHSLFFHVLEVILGIIASLSFLDFIGIPVGKRAFEKLEERPSLALLRMLENKG